MKVIKSSRYCRQLLRHFRMAKREEKKLEGRLRGGTPSELSPEADVVDGRGGLRRRQRGRACRKAQDADWKRVARLE